MKSLSASIVVLAGAILLLGGSLVPHHDTKVFVHVAGGLVLVLGLGGWFATLKDHRA